MANIPARGPRGPLGVFLIAAAALWAISTCDSCTQHSTARRSAVQAGAGSCSDLFTQEGDLGSFLVTVRPATVSQQHCWLAGWLSGRHHHHQLSSRKRRKCCSTSQILLTTRGLAGSPVAVLPREQQQRLQAADSQPVADEGRQWQVSGLDSAACLLWR